MSSSSAAIHVAKIVRKHKGRTYVSYLLRRSYRQDGQVKHRSPSEYLRVVGQTGFQPLRRLQSDTIRKPSSGKLQNHLRQAQIVVEPQDEQFMVARISENGGADSKDTVHPLTPETSIMDDNFFSHMEVITWKYMAFGWNVNWPQIK